MPTISGHAIGMLVPARNAERFIRKGFPFVPLTAMSTVNNAMALDDIAYVMLYLYIKHNNSCTIYITNY